MVKKSPVESIESTLAYYTKKVLEDVFDGEKFPDSFGITKSYAINTGIDYFTLRQRSYQLFTENIYFSGLIKRLLRNEIFTGMMPEPTPIGSILWPHLSEENAEQEASKVAGLISESFNLYANDYNVFDYQKQMTFGEFQEAVRQEAILCGDVVVISRINQQTGLPSWEIISGNNIKTPMEYNIKKGNTMTHGVERDIHGRHVAYWVEEFKGNSFSYTRIPVVGEKSGRQISWMVYGGNKRLNEVRGIPLLASALYMLRDLDRYRDAELRAAVIGSIIPFFIEKSAASAPGGSILGEKAMQKLKGSEQPADKSKPPQIDFVPGMVVENLNAGETIKAFNPTHPNINFKTFEETMISAICWAVLEIPPEIGTLRYQSSYSASRQANNEFDILLTYRAFKNAKDFCQLIFQEFVIQSVLKGDLILPGFQEVVFNPAKWKQRAAWLKCEWSAISRPSVDMQKEAAAYILLEDSMDVTHERVARRFSGMSFRAVAYKRAAEKRLMDYLGLVAKTDEDTAKEMLLQKDEDDKNQEVNSKDTSKNDIQN